MTIVFENQDYAKVIRDPYFGSVLPQAGMLLSDMNGEMHPSQPNYLAMISGSTHRVFYDFNVDIEGKTIVDLLDERNLSWKSYQESWPGDCFSGGSRDSYVRKHNPFISFNSIRNNATRCNMIVDASVLYSDMQADSLPNYMFVTPDMNNDGHDTGLEYASRWLQEFLEPKLKDPVFAKTLFFITFDESESYFGNHIYSILLGPGIVPGTIDDTKYNHYSFLATVEYLFGLGNLELNDSKATRMPIC
ncbi:phosphoesterase family-domain-containing protein [Obelidium mucronatum]|nr:phosphoesterase family-domain-containing protein [Obelidium mucronatum]